MNSSLPAAQAAGYAHRPLENWLVFHIVFGKTVPDISRNAIANLGYAEGVSGPRLLRRHGVGRFRSDGLA